MEHRHYLLKTCKGVDSWSRSIRNYSKIRRNGVLVNTVLTFLIQAHINELKHLFCTAGIHVDITYYFWLDPYVSKQ